MEYYRLEEFWIGSYMRCKIYFYEQVGNPFFLVERNEGAQNVIYSFDVVEKELERFSENEEF